MNTRKIGDKGESLAKDFLEKQGYHILETNVHKRFGEIDLIVSDPKTDEVAFVEVKTRKNSDFGVPEAFVNPKKLARIQTAALLWIKDLNQECDFRIDVISIEMDHQPPRISHFKNVSQL